MIEDDVDYRHFFQELEADPATIVVYTDGSCWPTNGGKGGWAFVAKCDGREVIHFGCEKKATNNEMELTAIIRAMQFIRISTEYKIRIVTDSQYALNAITKWGRGWEANDWKTATGKPAANIELVKKAMRLYEAHNKHGAGVVFSWVKGHAVCAGNAQVDNLAHDARVQQKATWKSTEHVRVEL